MPLTEPVPSSPHDPGLIPLEYASAEGHPIATFLKLYLEPALHYVAGAAWRLAALTATAGIEFLIVVAIKLIIDPASPFFAN